MPRRVSPRISVLIAIFSACALLAVAPPARSDVSHVRVVRLSYTAGDVQLRSDSASAWQKAVVNTPLREGMQLATGDGRAEVEFENGALAWMASNTIVELSQLVLDEGGKLTLVAVLQGTASFYVEPGKLDSFAVQAGQLQIHPPRRARFRVDVFDDGASVSVLRGPVDVDSRDTTFHVNNKRTLAFRNDQVTDGTLEANPHNDSWDRWVSDRSNSVEMARDNTAGYFDAPFGYGLADLSFYGGWVNLPGYGYGWQPYGVGFGWSPFYNGYWSSLGGFGPAWVSYEPWGWVPYHYGGWVFSPVYGWVWAPTSNFAWSPATVAFVRTATGTVGWVPRTPRETLGLPGTAGPNSPPTNLSHALLTTSGDALTARTPNMILRGSATAGAQPIGDAHDAAMVRFAQELSAAPPAVSAATPHGVMPAQRMPAAGAPRVANAGLLAGAAPRYHAPSIFRYGRSGPTAGFGTGSSIPSMDNPRASSSSPAVGGNKGAAVGHAGGAGGGIGGRKP